MRKVISTFCVVLVVCVTVAARAAAVEPDDIRVSPMLRSKWGQTTHNGQATNAISSVGKPCFDALTPGHAPCGCVVTAFAQVLRYLQYPDADVYQWKQMPLNTLGGVTDSQAQAIGGLCNDLGVLGGADYQSAATYVTVARLCEAMEEKLGFAQTELAVFGEGALAYSEATLRRIVIPNCDLGRPVVLSIDTGTESERHDVVVDGYGYAGGRFCIHARCGDYGISDGWFFPPDFHISPYDFNSVGEAAYNLLPDERGTIVSGRILKPDGTPCAEADIILTDAEGEVKSTKSSATGVYAFVVEHPGSCMLLAMFGENTGRLALVCEANVSPVFVDVGGEAMFIGADKQVIGNSYGNDIRLKKPPADLGNGEDAVDPLDRIVPMPKISPNGGRTDGKVTITLSDAEPGVTIRYTLDGTETTDDSPRYAGPFSVTMTELLHVRARASKSGMTPSEEASAVFLPSLQSVATPTFAVARTDGTAIRPQDGRYVFVGTVSVTLSSATPQTTLRYTLDGTEPTVKSPVYENPLLVSDDVVVTARAWRNGWLASEVASATIAYDDKSLPMVGDDWQTPMVIVGTEGARTSGKTRHYTLDADEARGNTTNPTGLNHLPLSAKGKRIKQFHSAWFSWTAPASGEVKFSICCPSTVYNWYWPLGAAVYVDGERTAATRLVQAYEATEPEANFAFEAVEDETYLIVAVVGWDLTDSGGYEDASAEYQLSWTMEDPQYAPHDDGRTDISGAYVALSNYVCRFTGLARRPPVTQVVCDGVSLREDTDYTCAYMDNVDAGTGTVIVAGCGRYKGASFAQFSLMRRNLTLGMVSEIPSQVVTGEPVTPPVTVRVGELVLTEGTDYDVFYADNVEEGTARVTVVGKGNLSGSVTRTFQLLPGVIVKTGETLARTPLEQLGVKVELTAKTTVKAEGLPKGLKLTGSVKDGGFFIEGKPTEALDGDSRIAYVRVTDENKVSRLYPLYLSVVSDADPPDIDPARVNVPDELTCGVTVDLAVAADKDGTVSAKGLPGGLKLIKVGSGYAIQGVPTAAGDFLVTFTTKKGKKSVTSTAVLRVAALPAWAQGTFAGQMGEGSFTLTVGAAGKPSVKAVEGGLSWTWSATGFDSLSEDGVFTLSGKLASGKVTRPFELSSVNWTTRLAGLTVTNSAFCGTADDVVVTAYHSLWTDKTLTAAVLPSVAGKYTHVTAAKELLTLTVDAKGTVKVAGTLADKRKLSLSSVLVLDDYENWLTFVWLAPDAKKGLAGFGRWLRLVPWHEAPGVYGDAAYRDAAVTATVGASAGCAGDGTVTLSPAYGQAEVGKTVTLTAKADKNSVFVKWVLVTDDGKETDCGYDTKLQLTSTGLDQSVRAVFRSKSVVEKPTVSFDREAFEALRVGVNFDRQVSVVNPGGTGDDLVRPVKFTAVNLPAGLKLDATSGRVYGVPTKTTDKSKPFSVTATSTVDKNKTSGAVVLCESVKALPDWALGTFVGNLGEGTFTMTVAATGKTSVKAANGGQNWTYSANGYASERKDDAGLPVFEIAGELVSGKQTRPFAVSSTNWVTSLSGHAFENAALFGLAACGSVAVYRTPWADKALAKDVLPKAGKYVFETEAGDSLTLTIDAKGGVKTAGTSAGGLKLSASSTIFVDETGTLRTIVYQAPNSSKQQPAFYLDLEISQF